MELLLSFNTRRVADRTITELIGIAKGLIADGVINEAEADFLAKWLEGNRNMAPGWPIDQIDARIRHMLADGVLDQEERQELFAILTQLVGGTLTTGNIHSLATALPLTSPAPKIQFAGKSFCLTGAFAMGKRAECENAIAGLGGEPVGNITKKLDYLVIGFLGNENWQHSTHGRKIEKALEYNKTGCNIAIIAEQSWAEALVHP